MNIDQLIKSWHMKASEEDYFSKYVFEYLAFMAFLKKKKFTDARTDRAAIQRLKRCPLTKSRYLGKIRSDPALRRAWEEIKEELDLAPLGDVSRNSDEVEEIKYWNCSHDHLEQRTPAEKAAMKGIIRDLDDWENMVECWHSIRNNLFHGGKNPHERRDRLAVKNGYRTLRPLVEIFLSDEVDDGQFRADRHIHSDEMD